MIKPPGARIVSASTRWSLRTGKREKVATASLRENLGRRKDLVENAELDSNPLSGDCVLDVP
jgi:transposase